MGTEPIQKNVADRLHHPARFLPADRCHSLVPPERLGEFTSESTRVFLKMDENGTFWWFSIAMLVYQ